MILLYAYHAAIFLSALSATLFRQGLKKIGLSPMPPYLWYVFIQETTLRILANTGVIKTTGFYYNIYRPIATTVFFLIFYRLTLNNTAARKLMHRMYIGYLAFTVFIFVFTNTLKYFSQYLSLATGFVISCFAILYLSSYFNLDNAEEERKWFPVILITVGVLAFYPVINISFSFYTHLLKSDVLVFGTKLYQSIPQIMSIFMYSCFTYAFYLCRKKI